MQRSDEINDNMVLSDIEEWDSLARITFLSFLDSEFGANVTSDEVKNCIIVKDLINLAGPNLDTSVS